MLLDILSAMTYKMQSCYLTYSCYLYIVSDMLVFFFARRYVSIWVTIILKISICMGHQ
jgi:hypothetical protein